MNQGIWSIFIVGLFLAGTGVLFHLFSKLLSKISLIHYTAILFYGLGAVCFLVAARLWWKNIET